MNPAGVWGRPWGERINRWIGAVRLRPWRVDIAISVVVFAVTAALGAQSPTRHGSLPAVAILAGAVTCGALVVRRRWPLAVLVVTIAGAEVYLTLPRTTEAVLAAPLIALYTVADAVGWRRSLTVGVLAVVVLAGSHMILRPASGLGQENLILVALGGLAIAAGDASRSRRAYTAEVEARARDAERDREQEARRRVTEERLRIARDLHDVVGHHLALINVQAGVAAQVLDDQPAEAKQALAYIREASRAGLGELRETIGLLREPGDPAHPTEPTEGLSGVGELIAAFRRAGLRVDRDVEGAVRPVPPAASLTAYRVIQESLTNVRKHAGNAAVTVRLDYGPAVLRIVVEDEGNGGGASDHGADGGVGSPRGTGHGIAGMRERVAALGGTLEAGPRAGGGFLVSVLFPLPENDRP